MHTFSEKKKKRVFLFCFHSRATSCFIWLTIWVSNTSKLLVCLPARLVYWTRAFDKTSPDRHAELLVHVSNPSAGEFVAKQSEEALREGWPSHAVVCRRPWLKVFSWTMRWWVGPSVTSLLLLKSLRERGTGWPPSCWRPGWLRLSQRGGTSCWWTSRLWVSCYGVSSTPYYLTTILVGLIANEVGPNDPSVVVDDLLFWVTSVWKPRGSCVTSDEHPNLFWYFQTVSPFLLNFDTNTTWTLKWNSQLKSVLNWKLQNVFSFQFWYQKPWKFLDSSYWNLNGQMHFQITNWIENEILFWMKD